MWWDGKNIFVSVRVRPCKFFYFQFHCPCVIIFQLKMLMTRHDAELEHYYSSGPFEWPLMTRNMAYWVNTTSSVSGKNSCFNKAKYPLDLYWIWIILNSCHMCMIWYTFWILLRRSKFLWILTIEFVWRLVSLVHPQAQIHLLGNPVLWGTGTAAVIMYGALLVFYLLRRKRQCYDIKQGKIIYVFLAQFTIVMWCSNINLLWYKILLQINAKFVPEFHELSFFIPSLVLFHDASLFSVAAEWHEFLWLGQVFLAGYLVNLIPYTGVDRTLFLHHYLPAVIYKLLLTAGLVEHGYKISRSVRGAVQPLKVTEGALGSRGLFQYKNCLSRYSLIKTKWSWFLSL